MPETPENPLVTFPNSPWIGEIRDGHLYCLLTVHGLVCPAEDSVVKTVEDMTKTYKIHAPNTPEWDEALRRYMIAVMTGATDD